MVFARARRGEKVEPKLGRRGHGPHPGGGRRRSPGRERERGGFCDRVVRNFLIAGRAFSAQG